MGGRKWWEGGKGRESEGVTNYTPTLLIQESAWPLVHSIALFLPALDEWQPESPQGQP